MSRRTLISRIAATSLGLKRFNQNIEWKEMRLGKEKALVPDQPLVDGIDFNWIKDRLLCLYDGAVVKVSNRTYRVGLIRRSDIDNVRFRVKPNSKFWVKSANPRKCNIGPQHGRYDRLADEDEQLSLYVVLYRIETGLKGLKTAVSNWMRSLLTVVKKVAIRVGLYAKLVWQHCKGYRRSHERAGHYRKIGNDERIWVKPCFIRGHYYGERLAA